jgi:hypothetical protein
VFRAPEAQYADAFHIQFKPRRKRLIRQIIDDDYKPSTIIVAGWDHPHGVHGFYCQAESELWLRMPAQ